MAISEQYNEAREMNDYELKTAIETIEEKLADLDEKSGGRYSPAKAEKRSELSATLAVFRNEADLRKPTSRPLTLSGGTHFDSGNRGRRFATAGEFYQAVARSAMPGNQVDARLFETRAAAGLNETVGSDGGFLVGTDYSREILANVYAVGGIAALCRKIQISGNANSIKINGIDETSRVSGSRWGGVEANWIGEAAEISATRPKFRTIELSLKKLGILIYATDEMLSDSSVLESVLTRIAGDELTFALEEAIINGTGAGQPLGVLASNAAVTVAKESGQKKETVLLENVARMWNRLFGDSQKSAVWLIHPSVAPQLYGMSLSVGTGGGPVYLPGGGLSATPYATLMGRPVLSSEHCQALGTLGDIILADFANGYIVAEKGGVQAASSIHVLFSTDQSVFRFLYRCDGQPVLASPITPFQGGVNYKQSHFVVLESRLT